MNWWRSPWVSRTLKLFVSVVLIAAVVWQVGFDAITPSVFLWEYFAAGVAVFLVSNFVGAYQWNLLLRITGIRLPTRIVTRAYFISLFFNNFLIGSIGGDVLRALEVRKNADPDHQNSTATGVATIVMDRFLGFFTMMIFAGVAALFTKDHGEVGALIAMVLGGFVVLGVLITSRRIGMRVDAFIVRILPDRMAQTLTNLRNGFVAMRHQWRVLGYTTTVSLVVQGLRIYVHYLCALSIGVDIPVIYFWTFIPLIGVAAAIPISSGGLGTREWAAVGLFSTIPGVGAGGVVFMELLAHLSSLVSSLPGALAFVFRSGQSRTSN
jgi:hypothetical protein